MRLFTAILLPHDVREHVALATKRLLMGAIEHEVRLTEPGNLHVTLNFFGQIADDRVPEWTERLAAVKFNPAKVFSDRFLFFPPRGAVRIVAVGLGGEASVLVDLNAVVAAVAKELGQPPDPRPYIPHITAGRNRQGRYAEVAGLFRQPRHQQHSAGLWPGPSWRVENFALVQSTLKPDGPEYRTIATFPAA